MADDISFNVKEFFSGEAKHATPSSIRELLGYASIPDIIYLAGGLPSPDTFNKKELKECTDYVLKNNHKSALQYSQTYGDKGLLKAIKEHIMPQQGVKFKTEELTTEKVQKINHIIITTGAQQGLSMLSRLLIDKGDTIIVEEPSYIGGLLAFKTRQPDMRGVELEKDGMDINRLEDLLDNIHSKEHKKVKFLYVVPDFQNPSGVTTSLEKRKAMFELAEKYNFLIIEDSPYKELRYKGEDIQTMLSMDKLKRVIQLNTFSKTGYPGLRIGYITSYNTDIIEKIEEMKQTEDLCGSTFNQQVWAEYINRGFFYKNIRKIKAEYAPKGRAILDALQKNFPDGDVIWTNVEGGLFLFVTFPHGIVTDRDSTFFNIAIKYKNIAYIPGCEFYPKPEKIENKRHIRLTFGFPTVEEIYGGVRRLAETYEEVRKK